MRSRASTADILLPMVIITGGTRAWAAVWYTASKYRRPSVHHSIAGVRVADVHIKNRRRRRVSPRDDVVT